MNALFKSIAILGLIITAIGPILTLTGNVDVELNKKIMLTGMILWFIGGVPWLGGRKLQPADSQVEI